MSLMDRKTEEGRRKYQEILEAAARVIFERGYEGASMQEIAEACRLTKAGLYHHFPSKHHLLFEIQSYGMDLFESQVLSQVQDISDPVERLTACMTRNVHLVTRGWSKEITVILHEHATLTGPAGKEINARKKRYVQFLERSFAEAMEKGLIREVNPTIAAYSFLGMVLWVYKWFRPDGELTDDQLAAGMVDLFFAGLQQGRRGERVTRAARRVRR
jgi:TetR/AcrR family transcriptional regulator, cholesterol catabolism regulator